MYHVGAQSVDERMNDKCKFFFINLFHLLFYNVSHTDSLCAQFYTVSVKCCISEQTVSTSYVWVMRFARATSSTTTWSSKPWTPFVSRTNKPAKNVRYRQYFVLFCPGSGGHDHLVVYNPISRLLAASFQDREKHHDQVGMCKSLVGLGYYWLV